MKQISLAAMMLLLITVTSCHKRSCDDEQQARILDNTWIYGNTFNTPGASTWTKPADYTQLGFYPSGVATDIPSISFRFANYPQHSGTYKIVSHPTRDYEMSIYARTDEANYYVSTGNDGATAKVTISNGKVNLYCDKVILKQDLFVGGDSKNFSFNLTDF